MQFTNPFHLLLIMFTKWINRYYKTLIITENWNEQSQSQIQTKISKILSNSLKLFFTFPSKFLILFAGACVDHHLQVLLKICLKQKCGNPWRLQLLKLGAFTWQFKVSSNLSIVELKNILHSSSYWSLSICFHHWSFESNRIKICIFKR